jgi:hypothetical protein
MWKERHFKNWNTDIKAGEEEGMIEEEAKKIIKERDRCIKQAKVSNWIISTN